jgi:integrase
MLFCGLRALEILALRICDFRRGQEFPDVLILRAHRHSRHRLARECIIAPEARRALSAYLTERCRSGAVGKQSRCFRDTLPRAAIRA